MIDDSYVMEIARNYHSGQVDKSGVDYIEHPMAVYKLVQNVPSYSKLGIAQRRDARWAALLHDVLEDCPDVSQSDLEALGIPDSVISVVVLLSRNLSKECYYSKISDSAVARVVKLADGLHNSLYERLVLLERSVGIRLRGKYLKGARELTVGHSDDFAWFVRESSPPELGWNG